ncbi:SOS response-associated peptidase family protein [Caulobacter hibisci]|uniref:SOS response-associated peptidase family protein n=1 Tax=Caulobacter hibisci TaxID=2035993 RepID=A0ABS0T0G5_9CAUL|nr:SOS response-associated peptidase family protein [Caulobacter hibisci]MBI1685206.1 SOS response-associated peptidase family protein [Caulobacter hibisci]
MCNLYSLKTGDLFDLWTKALKLPVVWEGQASNVEPKPEIRMTEAAPILRHVGDHAVVSMTKWGWPGPKGPVFNFVTEGRDFSASDRVLIPTDGFYEFTAPQAGQKRKTRWKFTLPGDPVFWIAGIVKNDCWTMLTTAPGPDIAPYHDRQVVVLPAERGREWLDLSRPQSEILTALPGGSLAVERDFPPPEPAGLFG